jgi:hypothetical protein
MAPTIRTLHLIMAVYHEIDGPKLFFLLPMAMPSSSTYGSAHRILSYGGAPPEAPGPSPKASKHSVYEGESTGEFLTADSCMETNTPNGTRSATDATAPVIQCLSSARPFIKLAVRTASPCPFEARQRPVRKNQRF